MRRKSSTASILICEKYADSFLKLMPEATIRNFSVTTSSIYIKTPDGYSLRIGDHNGKEKYKYKWNLGPKWGRGHWFKDNGHWRYFTSNVMELVSMIKSNRRERESHRQSNTPGKQDTDKERDL